MAIIKTELDNTLEKVDKNYNNKERQKQFLKELTPKDITNESLKCLYSKWLIRYYSEE